MKEKNKGQNNISFLLFTLKREEGRGSEFSKLLSTIYGDRLVGICRAKNESSSTRRGLRVGYQKHRISPRIQVGSSGNQRFQV